MMRNLCAIVLFFVCVSFVNAQQYIYVKQTCLQCMGGGVVASYYGPVYCPTCCGCGIVQVAVPNPNNTQKVCFQAAPNNGTYTRTSSFVTIYTETGYCKGPFSIYLHHGKKYIDFNNTWVCVHNTRRFGYKGNWYVIKW